MPECRCRCWVHRGRRRNPQVTVEKLKAFRSGWVCFDAFLVATSVISMIVKSKESALTLMLMRTVKSGMGQIQAGVHDSMKVHKDSTGGYIL